MSPSVALDVTLAAKPPRAMFLPFMMGHLFGVPFHDQLQRSILLALLNQLETATDSPDIQRFEYTWRQAREEGKAILARRNLEES